MTENLKNQELNMFVNKMTLNVNAPRTPSKNGVIEGQYRSFQEMARTMLNENNLPKYFWAEAVNTACYVMNKVSLRPYELWHARNPTLSNLKFLDANVLF